MLDDQISNISNKVDIDLTTLIYWERKKIRIISKRKNK